MTEQERRELNERLAVHALGFKRVEWATDRRGRIIYLWYNAKGQQDRVPNFCGSWAGFGALVEAMEARGFCGEFVRHGAFGWEANWDSRESLSGPTGHSNGLPDLRLAAALAARAALEAEEASGE